jgi:hypothetical protein
MAANENTKFQINYKLNDGTLINLYATDVKDLETGLADLGMVATLIKATSNDLHGGAPAPTVASVAESFGATPVAAPAPVVTEGQAPTCKHGNMAFRTGTSARGPWKAWMCAAPKGAVDKCDPIFLR